MVVTNQYGHKTLSILNKWQKNEKWLFYLLDNRTLKAKFKAGACVNSYLFTKW